MEDLASKNAGSDFVCVEDMGKLSSDHEALQRRVAQMEKNFAELERARQEANNRNLMKWRIVKATALLALLATLAIIHEQHDRTVSFGSIMNRIAARPQSHNTYPTSLGRYHRLRSSHPMTEDVSNNAPLLLCFIVGLPYLVFTIVLYVIEILDIGSDQDLRTLVGATLFQREEDLDSEDTASEPTDETAAGAGDVTSQPIGDAPVFMSAPQLSSMDLNEDAATANDLDNRNNNTATEDAKQ